MRHICWRRKHLLVWTLNVCPFLLLLVPLSLHCRIAFFVFFYLRLKLKQYSSLAFWFFTFSFTVFYVLHNVFFSSTFRFSISTLFDFSLWLLLSPSLRLSFVVVFGKVLETGLWRLGFVCILNTATAAITMQLCKVFTGGHICYRLFARRGLSRGHEESLGNEVEEVCLWPRKVVQTWHSRTCYSGLGWTEFACPSIG